MPFGWALNILGINVLAGVQVQIMDQIQLMRPGCIQVGTGACVTVGVVNLVRLWWELLLRWVRRRQLLLLLSMLLQWE